MSQDNTPTRASAEGTTAEDLPKYLAAETPDGKDPESYTTDERRAEVLEIVLGAGSAKRINQSELARRYGVHQTTIKRDIDEVAGDVAAHLGHRAELKIYSVFEKALDDLLDENPREAWKTAKEFSEWLENRGALERTPERVNVDATVRNVGDSDSYTVIADDDAQAVEYVEAHTEGEGENEHEHEHEHEHENENAGEDA